MVGLVGAWVLAGGLVSLLVEAEADFGWWVGWLAGWLFGWFVGCGCG